MLCCSPMLRLCLLHAACRILLHGALQLALGLGMQAYVLSAVRETLVDANKEGVSTVAGRPAHTHHRCNMLQSSATCFNTVRHVARWCKHAATQRGHVCNTAAYVAVYIAGVELGRATLRSTRSKARCERARVRACVHAHACVRACVHVGSVVFARAAACCAGRAAVANIRCYRRASCTQTARSHSMTSVAL
jgi:hypothetical protein